MAQATAHDTHSHPPTALGLNSRKVGMWAFLSSEVMFFTGLIVTYLVMEGRNLAQGGPPPEYDLILVSALAFILLMSSVTMVLAVAATERDDRRKERIWLGATMLLGLTFLGGQVFEFNKAFSETFVTISVTEEDGRTELIGVHNKGNEVQEEIAKLQQEHPGAQVTPSAPKPITWTTSLYGSTFFTLTGFHGTHVGIGVLWLGIVLVMSLLGNITSRNALTVEMAGLYWHFVDLVWVAIFTLVYLI